MIFNFRSKDAESIWRGYASGAMPPEVQHVARRKLRMLNSARRLGDLRTTAEAGDRYSLRIGEGARIVFTWRLRGASDVDLAP